MSTARSILITDCLQNDFVGPIGRFDGLPNALHVGHDESLRLLGADPSEGPVARMMAWANAQPDQVLEVIHVRDWHDPSDPTQRSHLEQFGHHCIKNTVGAEFVFSADNLNKDKRLTIVDATTLSNFTGAQLAAVLDTYRDQVVQIGLMGVWTEAKITFLAYDLRSRYPNFQLAVCSALTASSSRENHFIALDQMERILGVSVIPSVGEFIEYLGGRDEETPLIGFSHKHPEVRVLDPIALSDTDHRLVRYLFRGCREVELRVLDGGFSGNVVLGTRSVVSGGPNPRLNAGKRLSEFVGNRNRHEVFS
ncbi:MAG: cysteine hydrolase [Gammaproteobacteria bacterium]|nr:cysteine hydrolase [Gammaproteobacteria bacterium]